MKLAKIAFAVVLMTGIQSAHAGNCQAQASSNQSTDPKPVAAQKAEAVVFGNAQPIQKKTTEPIKTDR